MKACITCRREQPPEAFLPCRKGSTRRRSECRQCCVERSRIRRAAIKAGTWVPKRQRIPTGELRTCVRCQVEKDTSLFDRDSSRPGGLHSYCKPCRSAHNATYLTRGTDS